MKKVLVLLPFLLLFPVLALAQEAGTPFPDITSVLAAFVTAIRAGQWPVVAVMVLVALVWLLRTLGVRWIPWLGTSEGGTVLAFLTALAATLGAAALAGTPITWALAGGAAAAGFTAIGAWTGVRRLLRTLVPLVAKIPTVGPILAQVLSWLSGADTATEVQAKAEAGYKPLDPPPVPKQIASELGKPPAT